MVDEYDIATRIARLAIPWSVSQRKGQRDHLEMVGRSSIITGDLDDQTQNRHSDYVRLWFVWVLTIVYIHQLSSYGWFRKG